jgi:hypothetical protein
MAFIVTIAKRGLRLGIVYVGIGVVLMLAGIVLSGIGLVLGNAGGRLPSGVDLKTFLSLIGVPVLALAGLVASLPATLLFVHDKDNGTLESLLSMGFDQRGIFRSYLGASLILGGTLLGSGAAAASVVDLLTGRDPVIAGTVVVLVLALGLSTIALVAVLMSAFSALQRQPLGMNQPLGIAVGTGAIVAAIALSATMPRLQLPIQLGISGVVGVAALAFLAATPRLIRREKMLP